MQGNHLRLGLSYFFIVIKSKYLLWWSNSQQTKTEAHSHKVSLQADRYCSNFIPDTGNPEFTAGKPVNMPKFMTWQVCIPVSQKFKEEGTVYLISYSISFPQLLQTSEGYMRAPESIFGRQLSRVLVFLPVSMRIFCTELDPTEVLLSCCFNLHIGQIKQTDS